jgi:D-sedoheptulose 7-phosphate isomerase
VSSAQNKGLSTIGLVGHADSALAKAADVAVVTAAEGRWADRVQELHIVVIHMLVELIEAAMFPARSTESR